MPRGGVADSSSIIMDDNTSHSSGVGRHRAQSSPSAEPPPAADFIQQSMERGSAEQEGGVQHTLNQPSPPSASFSPSSSPKDSRDDSSPIAPSVSSARGGTASPVANQSASAAAPLIPIPRSLPPPLPANPARPAHPSNPSVTFAVPPHRRNPSDVARPRPPAALSSYPSSHGPVQLPPLPLNSIRGFNTANTHPSNIPASTNNANPSIVAPAAAVAAAGSNHSSRASSRPNSARAPIANATNLNASGPHVGGTTGTVKLGGGLGPDDGERLHSFRPAGPIPLTGAQITSRTGVGAVNLADALFKQLQQAAKDPAAKRTSLNKDKDDAATQSHARATGTDTDTGTGSKPTTARGNKGVGAATGMPSSSAAAAAAPSGNSSDESKNSAQTSRLRHRPSDARSRVSDGFDASQKQRARAHSRAHSRGQSFLRAPTFIGRESIGSAPLVASKRIALGQVTSVHRAVISGSGDLSGSDKSGLITGTGTGTRLGDSMGMSRIGKESSSAMSSRLGMDDGTGHEIEGLAEADATQKLSDMATASMQEDADAAIREHLEKLKQQKQISPFGRKTLECIDSSIGTLIMTLATIYCLWGEDIRVASAPPSADTAFVVMSTICFVAFIFEFVAFTRWRDDYKWSFFFWLDLIACLSLIPDMTFIWHPFMDSIGQEQGSNQNLAVARAGRAARAGTRAGRLVRFIRIVRLIRIVKLYKYCGETEEERLKREEQEKQAEELDKKQQHEEELLSEMDTEIGKGFSDYITKCVILIVLLMMFFIPLLEVNEVDTTSTFFVQQVDNVWDGVVAAEVQNVTDPTVALSYEQQKNIFDEMLQRYMTNMGDRLVYLTYTIPAGVLSSTDNTTICVNNVDRLNYLRDDEQSHVTGTWSSVIEDVKANKQAEAMWSSLVTLFVTVLLAGASGLFSKDANELVIIPIERMFLFVTRLAANPLGKIHPSGEAAQPYETLLLEQTFMKLAGLLQIGFGMAGAEVISHNMQGDYLDPMVPGRKVFAIFGFCDIRKFGAVTEALGGNVMIFCNQIADIVHELTHRHGGAANKNIGNAFLLVWKPTISQIRKVSMMMQQEASAQAATMLRDRFVFPSTHTIAEGEEEESTQLKSMTAAARRTDTLSRVDKKNAGTTLQLPSSSINTATEQWAQRTPRTQDMNGMETKGNVDRQHTSSNKGGNVNLPDRSASPSTNCPDVKHSPPALTLSASSSTIIPVLGSDRPRRSITNGAGGISGISGTNTTQTDTPVTKLAPPLATGGQGRRGSVSAANTVVSRPSMGRESSELSQQTGADVELSEAGVDGTDPMIASFVRRRPSHVSAVSIAEGSAKAVTTDSPSVSHGDAPYSGNAWSVQPSGTSVGPTGPSAAVRRGSGMAAQLIPAAIPEVSKSRAEKDEESTNERRPSFMPMSPMSPSSSLPSATGSSSAVSPVVPFLGRRESLSCVAGERRTGPLWEAMKHLADQALVAFLQTIQQVAITQELAHWRSDERMRTLLAENPKAEYEIDMGFGLHVGWAIEGAIGSIYKIDASYLSPNVNIASRLCAATKQYGVRVLISGPLYSLLQPEIQRRCRHLDRITVKGSKLPLDVYTFDVGPHALHRPSNDSAEDGPATARSVDGSHVLTVKKRGFSLGSIAKTSADDVVSGADVEVDDEGNIVQNARRRPEDIANEYEARMQRRRRHPSNRIVSNMKNLFRSGGRSSNSVDRQRRRSSATSASHGRDDSQSMNMASARSGVTSQNNTATPAAGPESGSLLRPKRSTPFMTSNKVAPEEMIEEEKKDDDEEDEKKDHTTAIEMQTVASHYSTSTPKQSGGTTTPATPQTSTAVQLQLPHSPATVTDAAFSPASPSSATSPTSPTGQSDSNSSEFTPSTLSSICQQLQRGLPDDFVKRFNEASYYYIHGKWGHARDLLEGRILKMKADDQPALLLCKIMKEHGWKAPKNWPGYRKLTSK